MKELRRKWMTAAVLLLVGGVLICGVSLAVLGFDFSRLNTGEYKTESFHPEGDFENIEIQADTEDIIFLLSGNKTCEVVCHGLEEMRYDVSAEDGNLVITAQNTAKWYENITLFGSSPSITVSLPSNEYDGLSISGSTGDVEIPAGFSFGKISMQLSTGDVFAEKLNCDGEFRIGTSTGHVKLKDVSCGAFSSEGSTGSIMLENVTASDSFDLLRSTGEIRFDGSDAGSIFAKTSTGDITGTLLSGKKFTADTSTGDIQVPESTEGGICSLETSTGDIRIELL